MGNTPLNSAQGGPSNSGEESRLLETVTILLRKLETATLNLSSSAVPGGSNTQVQFNDSGAFGGDAGLVYNKTTNTLTVDGIDIFSPSSNSIIVGDDVGSGITGGNNTIVGSLNAESLTSGTNNAIFGCGNAPNLIGTGNVIMGTGNLALATNITNCIVIGVDTTDISAGTKSNCILLNGSTTVSNSIVIGYGMQGITANTLVVGTINAAYFGNGETNPAPLSVSLNPTGGSGTDIAGANLTIAGGKPTGSGAGGHVIIQTAAAGASGTTLRSLSTIAEFTDDAKIGFFGVTPVVRQTTTSQTPATFVANTSLTADDSATWNGYTIGDIVAVLQAYGFLT